VLRPVKQQIMSSLAGVNCSTPADRPQRSTCRRRCYAYTWNDAWAVDCWSAATVSDQVDVSAKYTGAWPNNHWRFYRKG